MQWKSRCALVAAALGASLAITTGAVGSTTAAGPVATNGHKVQLVATGMKVPTAFAFGDHAVFAGDGGSNTNNTPAGGLFVLKNGTAVHVATSPKLVFVGGVDFHKGMLYVTGVRETHIGPRCVIMALSRWNGARFASQKVIYEAPSGFQGFNGLAFGANGRLYVGDDVGLLDGNDDGPANQYPLLYDILSMSSTGQSVSVFASGIRQPWQLAFPAGSNSPYVSDLGQDSGATNPPDFLLRVTKGQDYDFPKCNWTTGSSCSGAAVPYKTFAPHTDPGGVTIIGKTLYLGEFGFAAPLRTAKIVSMAVSGSKATKTVVDDLPTGDSLIGLGSNDGYLYFGVVTGNGAGLVYRVQA